MYSTIHYISVASFLVPIRFVTCPALCLVRHTHACTGTHNTNVRIVCVCNRLVFLCEFICIPVREINFFFADNILRKKSQGYDHCHGASDGYKTNVALLGRQQSELNLLKPQMSCAYEIKLIIPGNRIRVSRNPFSSIFVSKKGNFGWWPLPVHKFRNLLNFARERHLE